MKIYVTNLKKLHVIHFGFLLNNPGLVKRTVSNLVSFASTRFHKIAFSALVAMKPVFKTVSIEIEFREEDRRFAISNIKFEYEQ